jgi:hypothetical protein
MDYDIIIRSIDRDGFALLPKFMHPTDLTNVTQEAATIYELSFSPTSKWHIANSQNSCIFESIPNCPAYARISGSGYQALRRQWPCLASVSSLLLPSSASSSSSIASLMTHLFGPQATLFNDQYIIKPSKSHASSSFKWHRDSDWCTALQAPNVRYLSLWVALTDTSLDNGCLMMRPGSHNLSNYNDNNSYTEVLEMKAGDAVVFTDKVLHCSGPNNSAHVRMAWMPQFSDGPIIDPVTDKPVSLAIPLLQ